MNSSENVVIHKKTVGKSAVTFTKERRVSLVGAIFLMATSAIGPGFITQTATFTATMGAAFAFGILASIVMDFIIQMNIWRVITLTKMNASEVANKAIPGSGYLLAVFIIFGGLVFNVGNIAGTGLGLNALIGLDPKIGGALSALVAIGIFMSKRAGVAMDRIVVYLGVLMIAMTLFVVYKSNPPVGEAFRQTVFPDQISFPMIITIVGGTVGGYITYAGAHRLLDGGLTGPEHLDRVTKAAVNGILVTGIMRYVLFLAILGVVASGVIIDVSGKTANPAAQAFMAASGEIGFRIFGLILWAAGITSVIGAAYTSISFTTVFKKNMSLKARSNTTIIFIAISLVVYLALGTAPAALLVFAGGFNGLILPIGLTIFMYVIAFRSDLLGNYQYPKWLLASGIAVCLLTWYMGFISFKPIFSFLTL